MSSYHRIIYHLVFRTKGSRNTLNPLHSKELYAYFTGIIKNKQGFSLRINGTENHVHILCELHPSLPLTDLVKALKTSSNQWMRSTGNFPRFSGWGVGYGAFTCSWQYKDIIINYIKNQQEHHRKVSFEDELKKLLKEEQIDYNDIYFP